MVDTTTNGFHSLWYTVATIWNNIPDSIKMIDNLAEFKSISWKHEKCIHKWAILCCSVNIICRILIYTHHHVFYLMLSK